MTTWVLMVLVFNGAGHDPRALTSVPGYATKTQCMIAAGATEEEFKEPSDARIFAWCIPGPDRLP